MSLVASLWYDLAADQTYTTLQRDYTTNVQADQRVSTGCHTVNLSKTSRKHTYIILTPSNPTFI